MALPRSLSAQTLAVLIVTLLVSHVIGIAFYSADRSRTVVATEAHDFAERVVGMVNLLDHLPDDWRADIVREADGRTFHVTFGPLAETPGDDSDEALSRDIASYLADQMADRSSEDVRVALTGEDAEQVLNISIRLGVEGWLNFVGSMPASGSIWLTATGAYLATMMLGVGTIAMWLVFRVTSPLTAFARAADELGRNLRADPLPESGPAEVALASRAFNAMQARLRRLVENRTQILAALSHDLKTPVTLLRLRAEQMDESADRERMLSTLDEMEIMIASVLEFTRATLPGEAVRDVDLTALVGSVCDDLADAGADIDFAAGGTLRYPCRRIALKRALTNLVDNAVKYGGLARVSLAQRRESIDIVIEDDGPGIPESKHEIVFMPFYRLDESRSEGAGGVGLGLSIAQAIVQAHGGDIRLENRATGGLRVLISLPRGLQAP
ncbi:MAG: ATP-binding protein [Alphaproteobacteria bacterium]